MIAALLTALAAPATAASVAATVRVHGDAVAPEAARSLVWHALAGSSEPLILGDDPDQAPALATAQVSTLFDVEVDWRRSALWLDARVVWADAPRVRVTEYVLRDGTLSVQDHHEVVGEPLAVRGDSGWVQQHEASLQQAMSAALDDVRVPGWGSTDAPLNIPIRLLADEAFQERYPDGWESEARARIARAGQLLRPAGLALEVVEVATWTSPPGAHTPLALLEDLADDRGSDPTLRIGLSGQGRALRAGLSEDVGAAYVPGRHLVVMDHGPGVTQEAIAVAHEVLHALGVPHPDGDGLLMSPTLSGAVHRLDPASRELARAAAQARWAHWDPEAAAALLADAAATWIHDPELQLVYVARNLAASQGADDHTPRWSALAREALGTPISGE